MPALAATLAAAVALLVLASTAGATGFKSGFTSGHQSWRDFIPGAPAQWLGSGGHPGGYIIGTSPNPGAAGGVASPAGWAGDRVDLYGGEVSFDAKMDPSASGELKVRIDSPGFLVLSHSSFPITGKWKHFKVPLKASDDWNGGNGPVTKAVFEDRLHNFSYLALVNDPDDDSDRVYVDNVIVATHVARTLTLGRAGKRFGGKLKPASCSNREKVSLFRKRPGPDAKIGSDKTDSHGEYAITKRNARAGNYYASVSRRFKGGAGYCLAAKSKTRHVGR